MNNSPFSVRSFAVCLTAISLFALTGCGEEAKETTTVAAPVIRPALIETVSASDMTGLNFNGVVRSAQRADLAFRLSGKLVTMNVEEGDRVSKGQVLAQLDQREFKIALSSAETELRKANADYQRGLKIYNSTQAISQSDLEQLQTKRDLAQNKFDDAKRNLENATITAPFSGMIARKLVNNFTQIQANQAVYVLHNLRDLEVTINIPSKLLLEGGEAREAIAEFDGLPDVRLPLTYKYFSSDADPLTQTYEVVLGFSDLQGQNILPGMTVRVLPKENAGNGKGIITVPLDAVIPTNTGEQYVWVVNADQSVEKRLVTVGRLLGNRVTVTDGLSAGDKLVTAGVHALKAGIKVRPMQAEGSQ